MNFLEMQNAVLSDRFRETKRSDAMRSINYRYGRLWAQEPWSFKLAVVDFSVGAGAQTASLGTLQRVHAFSDKTLLPTYTHMAPSRPEDYLEMISGTSGVPYDFTIINNTIRFDRPLASARTFTAVGELAFVQLTADSDVPLLPVEFHMTPVHGAISEMLRLENDPSWNAAEADFQAGIQDMRKSYLSQVLIPEDTAPAWPAY